ncbi:hypothetical protein J6590_025686 [Homalodisca vitripennis]|nr:hypothetical protein J6590_025686 [Homalodisca vitripennis]
MDVQLGRYTRDITDFHIVVPQKVHPNGSFHSHHLPHYFHPSVRKKRNLEDERIHYLLHFGGLSHVLELEPNAHITSPGMLVETRATGSDISGATFRRPRRHLCHFHGSVRGSPGSRVAISSCDGLVGMIRTASGTFFVEPLHGESPEEGKEHIHVVYKRSLQPTGRSCNVRGDDWWSIWTTRLRQYMDSHPVRKRSEAGVTVQRWYELMIATDKKFLTFHKDIDVEEYVICIMNMVADYYHDKSVGNLIDIVIVRIIYLEKQEEEIDLETSNSGESTLDSFCIWQAKMNPKDYFHPNHHDLGVLLTRYDICSADEDGCNLLGLAHMGTACSNDLNCCINEDSGLILGITATHEIGHTLSCTHDAPEESGCEPVTAAGDSTIMNPAVQAETSAWSPCSRGFITGLFDSQMGECMLDEPKEHTYPLDEMPPGAFYDADEQCSFLFGSKYVHFDQGGLDLRETQSDFPFSCIFKSGLVTYKVRPTLAQLFFGPNFFKMLYNYKRLPRSRKYADYSNEHLQTCLETIRSGLSFLKRHPQSSFRLKSNEIEVPTTNVKDLKGSNEDMKELVVKDKFVVVHWNGLRFPGLVLSVAEEEATVECMAQTKKFLKWPQEKDTYVILQMV